MAVDRSQRDELAESIEQWMRDEISSTEISRKVWKMFELIDRKDNTRDELLCDVLRSWLREIKCRDGDRLILSKANWDHVCEWVVALRSHVESPEKKQRDESDSASGLQIAILVVWTLTVVALALVLCYMIGPLGCLLWVVGPIPYLIWFWWKWMHQRKLERPRSEWEQEWPQFQALRQQVAFPPYDSARFKPTRRFVIGQRIEIAFTGMLVVMFLIVAVLPFWPLSIGANLRQESRTT